MAGIPGLGLSSPLGLGVDGDHVPWLAAPSSGSNPNLLLAPEDFTSASWIKPAVTVTADVGDATHPNADQLVMPFPRQCVQSTSTSATSGSSFANITVTTSWARYSTSATVDGLPYCFSVELLSVSGATDLRLQIDIAGGVIRVGIFNQSGSTATFLAWGAKLEQAPSFSGYP